VFSMLGKAIRKRQRPRGARRKCTQVLVLEHTPLPPSRGDFLADFAVPA